MTQPGNNGSNSSARVKALFEESSITRKFERGAMMMRFDSEEPAVFLLLQGTAALQVSDQNHSNELNVTHLVPGDVFGSIETEANSQINMYVVAKTACTAYVMTPRELSRACTKEPLGMFAIFKELSRTSLRSVRKVGQFAFFDVRGRVSSALVELCGLPDAESHPDGYLLKNSRVEIASMVGCTREMVGKVMKELSDAGLITIQGRQTLVHTTASTAMPA